MKDYYIHAECIIYPWENLRQRAPEDMVSVLYESWCEIGTRA
jgi:hypothetical protein